MPKKRITAALMQNLHQLRYYFINHNKLIILFVLILALALRLCMLFFDFGDNLSMGRIAAALSILENPRLSLNFDPGASVLYHYMLAAVLCIWPAPLLAPRVLSILFGILSIIPTYLLIRMLFNERIAIFSSILVALYPLHVIQSSLATSDIIFYFFFFSSLYYFFKFKLQEKKVMWLIISATLLNIALMLRFESWLFIPLLALFLYKEGKRYMASFFFLSLILPAVWLYLCQYYYRDAFYTFNCSAQTARGSFLFYGKQQLELFGWFKVLLKTLGHAVLFSGICGMVISARRKTHWYLSALFLCLYCLFTINALLGRMAYFERYSIFLGLLLLPYSAVFLDRISIFVRVRPVAVLSLFVVFACFEFIKISNMYVKALYLPDGIKETAMWVKNHVQPNDKIIFGSDKWNATDQPIIVYSGISLRHFLIIGTPLAKPNLNIRKIVADYLVTKIPHYLVLNSTGCLQQVMNFDMAQKKISDGANEFILIYSYDTSTLGKFNIYEIRYK